MEWIGCDPEHREKRMSPDFFYEIGKQAVVLADSEGPGLFVRLDPEAPDSVRLHIQFSPNEVRSCKTMLRGWPDICQCIWNSGVTRMVFESTSPRLIAFCCRVFDFKHVKGSNDYELVREG